MAGAPPRIAVGCVDELRDGVYSVARHPAGDTEAGSNHPATHHQHTVVLPGQLLLDDDLRNYIHVEQLPQQTAWTIDLGDANVAMLTPLLEKMFLQTRAVDGVPVADAIGGGLDGVVHPRLDRFEFDVPFRQQDKFAEVWIQYVLTLYNPDGSVVTEWPVNGYGKAEIGREAEDSVHRAAVVALREVGAAISTNFAVHPDVSLWLQERGHETALSAGRGQ